MISSDLRETRGMYCVMKNLTSLTHSYWWRCGKERNVCNFCRNILAIPYLFKCWLSVEVHGNSYFNIFSLKMANQALLVRSMALLGSSAKSIGPFAQLPRKQMLKDGKILYVFHEQKCHLLITTIKVNVPNIKECVSNIFGKRNPPCSLKISLSSRCLFCPLSM